MRFVSFVFARGPTFAEASVGQAFVAYCFATSNSCGYVTTRPFVTASRQAWIGESSDHQLPLASGSGMFRRLLMSRVTDRMKVLDGPSGSVAMFA